jgi:hypothetical protein
MSLNPSTQDSDSAPRYQLVHQNLRMTRIRWVLKSSDSNSQPIVLEDLEGTVIITKDSLAKVLS